VASKTAPCFLQSCIQSSAGSNANWGNHVLGGGKVVEHHLAGKWSHHCHVQPTALIILASYQNRKCQWLLTRQRKMVYTHSCWKCTSTHHAGTFYTTAWCCSSLDSHNWLCSLVLTHTKDLCSHCLLFTQPAVLVSTDEAKCLQHVQINFESLFKCIDFVKCVMELWIILYKEEPQLKLYQFYYLIHVLALVKNHNQAVKNT
jgi:hypothetical protein